MLTVNTPAPQFTTQNQDGQTIRLADFLGKKQVVLYFYPRDDTPGCTIQANQFTDQTSDFAQQDAVILGVSKDSCESHLYFIDKFGLRFDLLSDPEGVLCEQYGVWQEKEKNGTKKMGIVRSTFIINKSGVLVDVEYGVNPEGHAQKVLDKIESLG